MLRCIKNADGPHEPGLKLSKKIVQNARIECNFSVFGLEVRDYRPFNASSMPPANMAHVPIRLPHCSKDGQIPNTITTMEALGIVRHRWQELADAACCTPTRIRRHAALP